MRMTTLSKIKVYLHMTKHTLVNNLWPSLKSSSNEHRVFVTLFFLRSELERKKEAKQKEREAREKEARKREKAEEKEKRRKEYNAQVAALAAQEQQQQQQKKKSEEKKKKNGQPAGCTGNTSRSLRVCTCRLTSSTFSR